MSDEFLNIILLENQTCHSISKGLIFGNWVLPVIVYIPHIKNVGLQGKLM